MRIKKISLEGDLSRFGGRTLVVATDKGIIRTPNRTLTSQEIQFKAKLPFEPPLNNEISEIVSKFDVNSWDNFMKKNGPFDSRLSKLMFFTDKMGYTLKRYFPDIASEITMNDPGIKQLIVLQSMSDLDFISLPTLKGYSKNFKDICCGFAEEVLSLKREPLIYLDMGLKPEIFAKKYNDLVEFSKNDLIKSIGLIYRPIRTNILNYRFLWENRGNKIFLQMSGVSREYSRRAPIPTMHLLQKFGIDSFSVKMGMFFWNAKETQPLPELINKTKRLDQEPLRFERFEKWKHKSLNCNCPICKNKNAEKFIEKYKGPEDYPGQTFSSANRLHEFYTSIEEFKESQKFIHSGELEDYFKKKEGLKSADIPISKTKKLNEFK